MTSNETTDATPAWLTRLFPDVHDWQPAGTRRWRGTGLPEIGNVFDHVLIVCDPAETRFQSRRIADFAPERVTADLFEISFKKAEARLAHDMAQPAPGPLFGTPDTVDADGSVTYQTGDPGMSLYRRTRSAMWRTNLSARRCWHRARFVDYRNQEREVRPGTPGGDHAAIQGALAEVTSTGTPEYQEFLQAHRAWEAKWYRHLTRRPNWVKAGTVRLAPGVFTISETIQIGPGMTLRGNGS